MESRLFNSTATTVDKFNDAKTFVIEKYNLNELQNKAFNKIVNGTG
jgi:hypothetical protein